MKTLPTLYKKASTGKVQQWSIGVENSTIVVNHGQVDGKIRREEELIKSGKNLGKSNETTPAEQALAEATAKWEKKIKGGYVEDIDRAEAGEKDIEGGYDCMLAHKYADHGHKVIYGAYVQPKLNGHRCLAIIDNGKCTLWSRTRKPINSMPHIVAELEAMYPKGFHMRDGELYNHKLKHDFERLSHLIRQETPQPGHTDVEYHMYDINAKMSFAARTKQLCADFTNASSAPKYLVFVETHLVEDEEAMLVLFEDFLKRGYEGAMVRNADSMYESKRSYHLQKVKKFVDDDFKIVGIKEGRGTYAKCGIFICKAPLAGCKATCICDNCTFEVKMRGPKTRLMEFLAKPKTWKDKVLVVKYQYISKYGIPIFPVGEQFKE